MKLWWMLLLCALMGCSQVEMPTIYAPKKAESVKTEPVEEEVAVPTVTPAVTIVVVTGESCRWCEMQKAEFAHIEYAVVYVDAIEDAEQMRKLNLPLVVPIILVVDSEGVIQYSFFGFTEWIEIEPYVKKVAAK